ncbi:MAG: choice-of-anchor D domain-containing protein, partial [Candidatus Latescibacteria bacterium]|nr:choice-of-anchor D domain-containing protein [Candidatus Latescibacterota bacterium]
LLSNGSQGEVRLALSGTGLDTPPAAPASLSALPGRSQVLLNWPGNREADLAYYALYRGRTGDVVPEPAGLLTQVYPPALTWADSGLGAGTYYYRAMAVDSAGNRSLPSPLTQASLAPLLRAADPSPPSLWFRGAGTQFISLADSGNAALTLTPTLAGPDAALFSVDPTGPRTLAPGASQAFALSFAPGSAAGAHRNATLYLAHDAGNRSSPLTVALVGDLPPRPPADLRTVTGANHVSLSWSANPEADLSHYVVYHSTSPAALGDSVGRVETPGISFLHSGLPAGRHFYRLRAVDAGSSLSASSDQAQALIAPVLMLSLATTPPALPFGSVRTDSSKSLSFSIANEGSAPLTVSSIGVSGTQAGMFSAIPASLTIEPGEPPRSLSVIFAPTAAGEQRAVLSLLHNAAPAATLTTVELNGTGALSAPLEITPDPLDFGRVRVGQRRPLTLTWRNRGGASLSVTRIGAGDSAFALSRSSLTLPPGGSDTLTATFVPADGMLRNAVLSASYYTAQTGTAAFTSILTGQGLWPRLEILPADSLRFGDVPPGEQRALSLVIANPGNDTLLASAISTHGAFVVSPSSFVLAGGAHRELSVSFAPTAPRGDTGSVVLSTNAGRLSVGLSGRGAAARLALHPASLDFGKVWLGGTGRRLFRAANLGNQPLSISGAASDNPRFAAQPRAFDLEGGDSLEVAVRFSPLEAGLASGTLSLGAQGALAVHGEGVRLGLPDSLLFDQVLAGESGALNLVVFNPADDTLQIHGALVDRLQLFQVDEAFSPAAPLRIPPNSSQGLRVRFTPAGTGVQRALLTLSTNAGVHTLPLVGAVSDVAVRLSPAEFGEVRLGHRQTLRVVALNRTAASLTIDSLIVLPAGAPVQVLAPQLPFQLSGRDSAEVARLEFSPRDPGPLDGVSLRVVGRGLERNVLLRGTGTGPRLELAVDTLVLGPAGVGEIAADSLRLRNSGNDTLHLNGISALPALFIISPTSLALPPGGSRSLVVQFRPTTGSTAADGRLEFTSDDPFALRPSVALRGLPATRAPVLQLVRPADTLRFGAVPVGQSQDQALLVRNRGQGLLKVWLRPAGAEFLPVAADTLSLGSGQEAELLARFIPASPGRRQGRLILLTNDPQVSTLSIPTSGLGAGLFFTPASLDLGSVAVGSAADTALVLVNQTTAPLEMDLSLTRGAFALGLQHLRLDAGARARIPLRFAPDQDGDFVARLRVVGQDLEVNLVGAGAPAPELQTPAALDLGEVELGQVGRRPLVLRNQGRGTLHLWALNSSRLEFGTADSLPLLVPPGGERIVQVWFAPRAPGPLRALLQLHSDDPDQPEWAIALSGQGRAGNWKPPRLEAQLADSAERFEFGSLAASARAEQILTLFNRGAGVLRVKRISAADPQVRAEPESLVVAPGERRQVRVAIAAAPGAPTEGILELTSDDPEHPLLRWGWHYRQAAARAQLLSASLSFGAAEAGRRRAQLTVTNQGEAQLIVDLADEGRQLLFAADRLLIAPGQVGRVQVEYRGQDGRGLLRLPSNDPSRSQLEIPWEAPDLLDLVRTLPAAGSTAVPRQSTLSLFFDQPPRPDGLELALTPAPLNAWRRLLQVQGNELRLPLELAADQTYKLVLLTARSQAGTPLAAPVELSFTTAAQPQTLGRLSGRVVRAGGQALAGTALLAGAGQELAGATRLDSAGGFTLTQLPAGTYHLFAREEGSAASYEYPQPLPLRAGQNLSGVTLEVPAEGSGGGALPLAAALELDQAPLLQPDSTFVLPIRTGPVRDLTGFSFQLSFDPQALRLVEALPQAPGARNLLYGAGGFPLFTTHYPSAGRVEFGGQLLAPRAETAPDSGGTLAYFVFRALGPGAAVRIDSLVRQTLRGTDALAGPTVRPAHGADFDGSGAVGLDDLFLMADYFGQRAGGAAARFDLDGSGVVDLGDFFLYADAFGARGEARAKLVDLARALFGLPGDCELEPAYPNPFNSQTLIPYLLPAPGEVHLEVYDLLGQRVRVLASGPTAAGRHLVVWDGRDDLGRPLASGLYLCRLRAGAVQRSAKLLFLR